MVGAGTTIDWVMPVRTVMKKGISVWGLTRVSKVPRHSPPRTLMAPTSVILQVAGDAPVVSRSRTQKVTCARGVPRSSKDRCIRRTLANMCSMFKASDVRPGVAFAVPTVLYRCAACGNLTRFDVTTTRRTRAFHHYSLGGELSVEDGEVLAEAVEEVSCRWCGSGAAVEQLAEAPWTASG